MSSAYAARRPVVLIVEDDLLIRLNAAQIIEEAEFDVIEASNADEAIAILEDRSDITVLFTDIQMPGSMDGLKLAAAVKGRWPPIKIVATSGLVHVRPDDLPKAGAFFLSPIIPLNSQRPLSRANGRRLTVPSPAESISCPISPSCKRARSTLAARSPTRSRPDGGSSNEAAAGRARTATDPPARRFRFHALFASSRHGAHPAEVPSLPL